MKKIHAFAVSMILLAPALTGDGGALAAGRVSLGGLSFELPAGWTAVTEKTRITAEAPKAADNSFSQIIFIGPGQDNGRELSENFKAFLDKSFADYSVAESKAFRLALPSGVENLGTTARIAHKSSNESSFVVAMILRHGGKLWFFTFNTASDARFRDFTKKDFSALMNGLRAEGGGKGTGGEGKGDTADRREIPVRTVDKKIAGFTVPIPADWRAMKGKLPPNQLLYSVAVKLNVRSNRPFPAVTGLYPGRCADPEKELKIWTERTFLPAVHQVTSGVTIKQQKTSQLKVPGGTAVAWAATRVYMEKLMHSHTVSVIVPLNGHSVIYGLTYEHVEVNESNDVKAIMQAMDAQVNAMLRCAAASTFTAPPLQAKWKDFLVKKGRWRYDYDSQIGSITGTYGMLISRINWAFSVDGTASVKSSDFSAMGFSVYSVNNPDQYLRGHHGASTDAFDVRAPFDVRGTADNDLWIFLRPKNGMGTFHRLEPSAQGAFGDQKIRGIAIDGRIEGSYSKSGGMTVWKP